MTTATETALNVNDLVRNRFIVAAEANKVTWVSRDGSLIKIDFGAGEILIASAANYQLA